MDNLYHAIAKTISLFKKDSTIRKRVFLFCLEFMIKLKSGLKNLLGYLSNFDPPKKLAIFDPLPQATFFCLFFLNKKIFFGAPQPTEMTYFGFTYFMDGP